ncbi:hypothetical protein F5887DRAFT_973624, partial [Amanita rubescens]
TSWRFFNAQILSSWLFINLNVVVSSSRRRKRYCRSLRNFRIHLRSWSMKLGFANRGLGSVAGLRIRFYAT